MSRARDEPEAASAWLRDRFEQTDLHDYWIALCALYLGDDDLALDALRRSPNTWALWNPLTVPVRDRPEFREAIRALGLEATIGALAPGMSADFVSFDRHQVGLAGADHDPVAALHAFFLQSIGVAVAVGQHFLKGPLLIAAVFAGHQGDGILTLRSGFMQGCADIAICHKSALCIKAVMITLRYFRIRKISSRSACREAKYP